MKVHLKFKSLTYARDAAEFLYKLHPFVLKQALDTKRSLGEILGFVNLNNMPYKQREQLSNLMLGKELTYEQREQISNFMRENNITYEQREDYIDFDVYLEIENVQYGRMLTELFEN